MKNQFMTLAKPGQPAQVPPGRKQSIPRKKRPGINKAVAKRTSALDGSNGASPLKIPQGEGEDGAEVKPQGDAVLSPDMIQYQMAAEMQYPQLDI